MSRILLPITLLALSAVTARAQWEVEESHTAADLRGVASVGGGVAWASGSHGTVIRTEDGGYVWQGCAVPPGAANLDFRAIQAWDENTAIVLSSGKGDASRLFRTTDGCRSWKPLFANPDREGFWDDLQFSDRQHGVLLGDPVDGRLVMFVTANGGQTWQRQEERSELDAKQSTIFAASNSSLVARSSSSLAFCTGGPDGAYVISRAVGPYSGPLRPGELPWATTSGAEELVSFHKGATSGCFSLASSGDARNLLVAVGGDYKDVQNGADAAWTNAGAATSAGPVKGFQFAPAKTGPHGYRSAVAYLEERHAWITVGPNGTDISTDDGVTWRQLSPLAGQAKDADQQWNALSLPFVVGPHGRVGKLRSDALAPR